MCEHRNSGVVDTRPFGATKPNGQPYVAARRYPYLCRRRRKCSDCGARFATVEVAEEYLERVTDRHPDVDRIRGLLRQCLDGLRDVTTTNQPEGEEP